MSHTVVWVMAGGDTSHAKDLTRAMTQCRAWCWTLFSEDDVNRLQSTAGISAIVVGEEICPTTGRKHFQGYVRFENNKRFSWWKNQFLTIHVEPRRGSEAQAAAYCRKEGRVIVDRGCEVQVDHGKDVTEHVLNMLESDAPLWQIYRTHRKFFFHNARKITDMEAHMKSWRECGYKFEKP